MTEVLVVLMQNDIAGHLTRQSGSQLLFVYTDAYRSLSSTTPLSVSMPLETKSHEGPILSAWLSNLLPDSEAVLRRWARTFQVSASSPFSLLSTPVGEDCAGAVRFVQPDRLEAALNTAGDVAWLDEKDLAARLRDLRADATAWLGVDTTGQFSLAGAQAKTALLQRDGRWGVPSGGVATSHILKPAITGLDGHDLNEHLCLRAAALTGLNAARSEVMSFEDQQVVVIQRYDRLRQPDGSFLRLHQEDLCQALGFPPERKYQAEEGPTSANAVALLRTQVTGPTGERDVGRFADALIFNWVIGGTDAHAKNYSLLLSGRQVRLAPLYDVGSALPYPNLHIRRLRLAMKFGGSYTLLSRDQSMWTKVAFELGLPEDGLIDRARKLIDQVADAFSEAAAEPGVRALQSPLPAMLIDAVAARADQCRETLH